MRRLATTVVFFSNGALFASVLPHLPAIKANAGLSDAGLGVAVASASAAALAAGPVTGRLTRRVGSGRLAVVCTLVYCCLLWLPAVAPSLVVLVMVFGLFGVLDAVTDVAMNTRALAIQRTSGRALMNGFHAWWGIGAVASSAAASLLVSSGRPMIVALAGAATVIAGAVLAASPWLWRDPGIAEPASTAAAPTPRRLGAGMLALLGAAALLAAMAEDIPSTWSAVYVRDSLDGTAGVAAGAYVAFVVGMTAGRLTGDRLAERFGAYRVLRAQALILTAAMLTVIVSQEPWMALMAFGAVGLGVAGMFPAVLSVAAAGGDDAAAGTLAYLTWLGRVGFLLAPPVVGMLSSLLSLRWGLATGVFVGLALFVLSGPLNRTR